MEVLDRYGFGEAATRIAQQALELLHAPNCPTGTMDVLLAPDQMMLQIHESIGHPLELDRILGDERNYAGTSFVTPDMFGGYRYGSDLLNVSFDPGLAGQLASYGFDDDGHPPSAGSSSTTASWSVPSAVPSRSPSRHRRSRQLPCLAAGTARRSIAWPTSTSSPARPPSTSWSRRSPTACTSRPTRRGPSTTAATSSSSAASTGASSTTASYAVVNEPQLPRCLRHVLAVARGVGDTVTVMGTPNCGKGELNQMVGTGHASPPCLFGDVEVFGGES